nr:MAG TPA: hypothetical protein [Caudoviricetes sp.]
MSREINRFPINSHYHYKLSRRTGLGQFWDNF